MLGLLQKYRVCGPVHKCLWKRGSTCPSTPYPHARIQLRQHWLCRGVQAEGCVSVHPCSPALCTEVWLVVFTCRWNGRNGDPQCKLKDTPRCSTLKPYRVGGAVPSDLCRISASSCFCRPLSETFSDSLMMSVYEGLLLRKQACTMPLVQCPAGMLEGLMQKRHQADCAGT